MKIQYSKNIKVNLNNIILEVDFFKYFDGTNGFRLMQGKKQIACCTINLEKCFLNDDEVIIKDYDQNNGMYKALLDAKLIKPYTRRTTVGNNKGLICKLNNDYVNPPDIKNQN